jgi:5'-deoxynucleotidase YfbR-like HD superfamily hydrolase
MKPNTEFFIKTFSGKNIDPLCPDPEDILIEDIAHALSNQCRFAGHVREFYSVAQHSVHVSQLLQIAGEDSLTQLAGLLHDASEAYLVDLPTPIKRQMPKYCEAEDVCQETIMLKFLPEYYNDGNHVALHLKIKNVDLIMLATEARDLHGDPQDWKSLKGILPENWTVTGSKPEIAKAQFLRRYKYLTGKL